MYFNTWGHFSFIISTALAAMQVVMAFAYAKRLPLATFKLLSLAQLCFVVFAFATLTRAFVVSDYSVLNVFMNSHFSQPLFYKYIALWSNHEGSMLLWGVVMSVLSFILGWVPLNMERVWHIKSLGMQAALTVLFFLYIIFCSNPFDRLWPVPTQGYDLNPLLQDPGLAFHPPALYLGYVGFSLLYALAMGWALAPTTSVKDFIHIARPLTLLMWGVLTLGIIAGSWWAYYVLGWGGWWFWDPVENIALLPWLAAIALMHCLRGTPPEKLQTLLFLAALPFTLGVGGTFLVRSGLLTSVHSFATDLGRLHGLLFVFLSLLGIALTLFWRSLPQQKNKKRLENSKLNQVLSWQTKLTMFFLVVVMTGLLYPLVMLWTQRVSFAIGGNYFEQFLSPLLFFGAIIFCYYTCTKTVLSWLIGGGVFFAFLFYQFWDVSLLSITAFGSAAFFLVGSFIYGARASHLIKKIVGFMHGGLGVFILVVTLNGLLHQDGLLNLKLGEKQSFGHYDYMLKEVQFLPGDNYMGHRLTLEVSHQDSSQTKLLLFPERRFFLTRQQFISESKLGLDRWVNIQVIAGDQILPGQWQVRVHEDPFIGLIWGAGIICGLAAILLSIVLLRRQYSGRFV